MVGISSMGKNVAVEQISQTITLMSLHTDDPGDAGLLHELPSGVYSRQLVEYAQMAADGSIDLATDVVFTLPVESTTIRFAGLWSGSIFMGTPDVMIPTEVTMVGGGDFIVNSAKYTVYKKVDDNTQTEVV